MIDLDEVVSKILSVPDSEQIVFIILYGSYSNGSEKPGSDIDICIHHTGTERERAEFRFKALTAIDDDRFDIHTYVDLPLYIKKDIFKGRVLYLQGYLRSKRHCVPASQGV